MTLTTFKSRLRVVLLLVLTVPIVGISLVLRGSWRDLDHRSKCQGNLHFLTLAMNNYHDAHGHYPPAYVIGPDGKAWHSWRALLLPHMDMGEVELTKAYSFNEPWDGPNNRQLHSRMPRGYACPGDPDNLAKGYTSYFVTVGPGTAFPGAKPTKHSDFVRSRSDTIFVVESVGQNICWLEPRDLSFTDMSFTLNDPEGKAISAKHRRIVAGMADGGTRSLQGISAPELRSMFLISP